MWIKALTISDKRICINLDHILTVEPGTESGTVMFYTPSNTEEVFIVYTSSIENIDANIYVLKDYIQSVGKL
jgi:hypothetical protein